MRLLVQASDALAAEPDVQAGVAALPGLIVPAHADWCAFELLDVDAPGLAVGGPPEVAATIERLARSAPRSFGS